MSEDGIQLIFDDDDEACVYDPKCITYDHCLIGPCEFAQQGEVEGRPELRCAVTGEGVFTDLWEPNPNNPHQKKGCPKGLWI